MAKMPDSIDKVDRAILRELFFDARRPYRQISKRVHLSTPAVIERVRRLERLGVIRRHTVDLDLAALGRSVHASIALSISGKRLAATPALLDEFTEVVSWRRVTGAACFELDVHVASTEELTALIDRLALLGDTRTSLVLAQSGPPRFPG
jgi:Lrp/AsnC family transcriptional regulator, leucine-responsive regulatory protein